MSLLLLLSCAVSDDLVIDTADTADTADTSIENDGSYSVVSALSGENSVSYSGQSFRHLLISDLTLYTDGLTERLNAGDYYPAQGDVSKDLDFYLSFDSSTSGAIPPLLSTDPALLQESYDAVSSDKDILGKLAGNDATGQHVDWNTQGIAGWPENPTPQALVEQWSTKLDAQAAAWVQGNYPLQPDGTAVTQVYITENGQDLKQLMDKFLRGGVAYSQGTDDYLDSDTEGKGLLSDHTAVEEGKSYTALEHAWDEGFGYFGATPTYNSWSDEEIADGAKDVDGDGRIDLKSELVFGHAVNAAKRDLGATSATDYSAQAFEAFLNGRLLLAETAGTELSSEQMSELEGYRDQAVLAWELAIASTAVHYINDVLQDTSATEYDFEGHAKHYAELKGFALILQFNPHSPMSDAQFSELHTLLGVAPVQPNDCGFEVYKTSLLNARTLLQEVYGFESANMGDENGEGGW
jgi:hypothetical protein